MKDRRVEVLGVETLFEGFFRMERYTLRHTLFKGGWSRPLRRELFRRNHCVAVLLYDPIRDEVVLLEQFRVAAMVNQMNAGQPDRAWLLEIVAGGIEEGETAAEVARREAWEEAGCEILELRELMSFYTTPGGVAERITLFYGRVDSSRVGGMCGLAEEDEDILTRAVPAEEAFALLRDGAIESGVPIIALQWLMLHRRELRMDLA